MCNFVLSENKHPLLAKYQHDTLLINLQSCTQVKSQADLLHTFLPLPRSTPPSNVQFMSEKFPSAHKKLVAHKWRDVCDVYGPDGRSVHDTITSSHNESQLSGNRALQVVVKNK